jgi:DNA-binding Lrp family transcriptional regulator
MMDKGRTRGHVLRPELKDEITQQNIQLIRHLQSDGRASYRELASKTGISERSVRNQIAELCEKGAMEITVVSDPRRLGFPSMALMGLRAAKHADVRKLADEMFDISGIDYSVTVGGRFDVIAEVVAKSDAQLLEIVHSQIMRRDDVATVELLPLLRLHHQQFFWDAAQSGKPWISQADAPALDASDWGIIRHLSEDGRASFLDLSKSIGVSESHIRTRFGRMTESGLIRVIALTHPGLFGYSTSAWLCLNVSGKSSVQDAAQRMSELPHVTYVAITSGRFDLMVEVVCKDKDELLQLVDDQVRRKYGFARTEVLVCFDFLYRKIAYADAGS